VHRLGVPAGRRCGRSTSTSRCTRRPSSSF
jgi:hypothetical protein